VARRQREHSSEPRWAHDFGAYGKGAGGACGPNVLAPAAYRRTQRLGPVAMQFAGRTQVGGCNAIHRRRTYRGASEMVRMDRRLMKQCERVKDCEMSISSFLCRYILVAHSLEISTRTCDCTTGSSF
jgi:hypothetical protein